LNWFGKSAPFCKILSSFDGGVYIKTPQYGIMQLEDRSMGRPRKSYYGEDEGLAIRKKMREFDLEESGDDPDKDRPIPVDQEDEDWQERMYER
jgi:hypothetical protein